MSRPVRRGGRMVEADGRIVTWSMAEGSRGRRWRWSIANPDGVLVAAHTVELDANGRFARLESVAAPGLLTLHREPDGSLHGNRVTGAGVEHLSFPAPTPASVVVGLWSHAEVIATMAGDPGSDRASRDEVLEVGDDLDIRIVRTDARPGIEHPVDAEGLVDDEALVDDEDLPTGPASTSWPLERD